MPAFETLPAFLGLSALVTLAPGPDNLMVLSLSLSRGRAAGLGFALGCALGCFTHTLWATLGVSAVLASSPAVFTALKIAGALYLLCLGITALRSSGARFDTAQGRQATAPWPRHLRQGFIANALNPKVALFFLAFMPQFVDPQDGSATVQMVILGGAFVLQTVLIFGLFALAADRLGRLLARHAGVGRWLDRLTGAIFIGLAARLALDSQRA